MAEFTSLEAIHHFKESLKDLGPLVEVRTLYQLPTSAGNLQLPITLEIRQNGSFFFASIADLEMVEEGRTREKAVLNCLETLFEIYHSYARIPSEQLTEGARVFLNRLRGIVVDTPYANSVKQDCTL